MTLVERLGYVALETTDLEAALGFYTKVARLQISEYRGETAFLRGGPDHHWLRLEQSDVARCSRIAYEVADDDALDRATSRLEERGIAWTEGGSLDEDRVERWVRFQDPNGMELELFVNMLQMPVPPLPTGVSMVELLHAVIYVRSAAESERFYREVLDFLPSDWIERLGVFMRAGNRFHHSLALMELPTVAGQLDHFCIEVEGIDDVMLARNNALREGAILRNDLLRHAPSGSLGIYVVDPLHGHAVEFCSGHCKISGSKHRPRVLPAALETIDVWQTPLPEIPVSSSTAASVRPEAVAGRPT